MRCHGFSLGFMQPNMPCVWPIPLVLHATCWPNINPNNKQMLLLSWNFFWPKHKRFNMTMNCRLRINPLDKVSLGFYPPKHHALKLKVVFYEVPWFQLRFRAAKHAEVRPIPMALPPTYWPLPIQNKKKMILLTSLLAKA